MPSSSSSAPAQASDVGSEQAVPSYEPLFCPWYPAPDVDQPVGFFFGRTELRDGRSAALIDPGAWTSAAGEDAITALAETCAKSGYKPQNVLMYVPLKNLRCWQWNSTM